MRNQLRGLLLYNARIDTPVNQFGPKDYPGGALYRT